MRTEIGAAGQRPEEHPHPSAGEVGAIVRATERASNTIMECAEALMGADASVGRHKALSTRR
jgi:hypothetical protein